MAWTSSTNEKPRNAYRILLEKPVAKRQLGRRKRGRWILWRETVRGGVREVVRIVSNGGLWY
jgi:hypothetical protein